MFQRYAVYYTPEGALAECGAAWLGWDLARGVCVDHPDIPGLDAAKLTDTPRRYGLHGTIKPPFFLAPGTTLKMLGDALEALCTDLAPLRMDRFDVTTLGGFVALTPEGDVKPLSTLAARVVTDLDPFRAPPSQDELARRRARSLSPSQERNLERWGYPYVMEDFRFHITLTGRIKQAPEPVAQALQDHFGPHLPRPFPIDSLTLTGQDEDGMFHEIHRFSLTG